MFGSTVLEVAIGLVFVYVVMSLLCTGLNELVARVFRWRANMLKEGIQNLLGDIDGKGLTDKLLKHPLIKGLTREKSVDDLPKWITAPTFISALLSEAGFEAPAKDAQGNPGNLKDAVEKVTNPTVKRLLDSLSVSVGDDVQKLKTTLENWYDDAMEQVTAWYKRRSEWVVFACAVIVCVGLNVDTLNIANKLARDSALRASVVASAETLAEQPLSQAPQTVADLKDLQSEIQSLGLPIGWTCDEDAVAGEPAIPWWNKVGGLALSIVAVSLGAPFWFDVLNKLLALRRKRESSGDEEEG